MDLQEILAKLGSDEQGVILKAIEDKEKLARFSAKTEVEGTLAGQVEQYKKALGVLGYEDGKDASEFATSIAEQLTKPSDEKPNLAIEELETRLSAMQAKLDAKETETKNLTIASELDKALGKKFIGKQMIIDALIKSGEAVLDEGKAYYKTSDGVLSLSDAVDVLQKDARFSELAVVEQKAGNGDVGGDDKGQKDLGVSLDGGIDDILADLNL